MRTTVLSVHPGLAGSSRLPVLTQPGQQLRTAEVLLLLGAGATAALATAFLDFGLRMPGHAIIRAVFPMALGLALAPRRMGGTIMGASALASALVIRAGGSAAIGVGALTSLVLTGPFLDLALARVRRGWRLYLGFALAGIASNMVALTIRAGSKLSGFDHLAGRPLAAWWPQAVCTYVLFGAIAGLVSALVWFQCAADSRSGSAPEAAQ